MRAKYGISGECPPSFKHKHRESLVWKGVVWASKLLQDELRWTAITGKNISLWGDKWMGDERLVDCSLRQVEGEEMEGIVRDYWMDDRGWKWNDFQYVLPASTLLKISDTVVDLTGGGQDRVGWLTPGNRKFTIQSDYRTLRNENGDDAWSGWKRKCKLRVQERVKVFMWLFAHNRVLSNRARWRRQLAASPQRGHCNEIEEDALHNVRDGISSLEV